MLCRTMVAPKVHGGPDATRLARANTMEPLLFIYFYNKRDGLCPVVFCEPQRHLLLFNNVPSDW